MTDTIDVERAGTARAWALVTAAQAGDMDAFGRLWDLYKDVVFRFVLFRVADRALAEDLTGETCLRALRRIGTVTYQGKDPGAWFVVIARHLILDHVKCSRYKLETPVADMLDTGGTGTWHADMPESHTVDDVMVQDLREQLEKVLSQLGTDQRECLRLRFEQEATVRETAEAMGRNDGAVKALQHRAVRRARELFAAQAEPLPYQDYLT